jgi:hypothetical protein
MKDNESVFSCMMVDQSMYEKYGSWDCFFIGTGFACFGLGIACLLIFRLGLMNNRESFKNNKINKIIKGQPLKKKYENNIFFKY